MSIDDKLKWESKYKKELNSLNNRSHSVKLELAIKFTKNNKALDLACGLGRNVIFLAQNNYKVDAFDISKIALSNIDALKISNITTKEIDLDTFNPISLDYDLIIMTNFLDKTLINKISNAMKNDSVFFIETFMNHDINEKKHSNPDFLLKENELKEIFQNTIDNDFEILDYDEYENEAQEQFKMMKQSIIVRKI